MASTTAVSGMIPEMESAFQSGVETGLIPGAVVMAKDLTGTPFINLKCCLSKYLVQRPLLVATVR